MYETILYELTNGILTITLNRPESYNACNEQLTTDLQTALKSAEKDNSVRVIILTGSGKAFCSGQDLKDAPSGGGFAIGPGGRPHPVGPWGPLNKQVLQLNLLIKAAENTPNEVTERTRVKLLNQLESLMQLVRELGRK